MEVGEHCSFPACKRLDFLPFVCEKCDQTFCKEHESPAQHHCTIKSEKTETDSKLRADSHTVKQHQTANDPATSSICSVVGCGRVGMVDVKCDACQKLLCLSHRHPNKHDCVFVVAKASSSTPPTKLIPPSHKAIPITKLSTKPKKDGKQSSLSLKVALMKLKQQAEGQPSIPQSERVYYEITLPKDYGSNIKPVFTSTEWTVGKMVDDLSTRYRLRNKNDKLNEEKLCLFLELDNDCISTRLLIKDLLKTAPSGARLYLDYQL